MAPLYVSEAENRWGYSVLSQCAWLEGLEGGQREGRRNRFWAAGLRWRACGWEGLIRAGVMLMDKTDGASVCALALT